VYLFSFVVFCSHLPEDNSHGEDYGDRRAPNKDYEIEKFIVVHG
jgi:hypothetical protein